MAAISFIFCWSFLSSESSGCRALVSASGLCIVVTACGGPRGIVPTNGPTGPGGLCGGGPWNPGKGAFSGGGGKGGPRGPNWASAGLIGGTSPGPGGLNPGGGILIKPGPGGGGLTGEFMSKKFCIGLATIHNLLN